MTMTGWKFWVKNESQYERTQRVMLPMPLPDEQLFTGQDIYWLDGPGGEVKIQTYRAAAYYTPSQTGVLGNKRYLQVLLPQVTLTGGEERSFTLGISGAPPVTGQPTIWFTGSNTSNIYAALGEINMPSQQLPGEGTTPPSAITEWHPITGITSGDPMQLAVVTGYQAIWLKWEITGGFSPTGKDFRIYFDQP